MLQFVITSPLSLARVTWWYGEDEIWPKALAFSPREVADLASRFAELQRASKLLERLWPEALMKDAHLVIGTIEYVEGRRRPPVRRHRRTAALPAELDLTEEARWADPALAEVLRLVDERTDVPIVRDPAALRPRLHGRWASA